MTDARRISIAEVRDIVTDADELVKGMSLLDQRGLRHFARFEDKLFSEASGKGSLPYRVTLSIPEDSTRTVARCTCLAARSRPFCKHAAALLVAWARAPESFLAADRAPEGIGEKKKREVKRGKTSAADLGRAGVEQVDTLVSELSSSGVVSIPEGRVEQIRGLGENLREHRLRRLSARTLGLAGLLEDAAADPASLDPLEYTTAVTDMLLLARRLERHFGGDELEPRHVEELIGKTWKKSDRSPIEGLDLVEYAFFQRTTSDDFIIRESRFFDVTAGAHYAEKQILPAFLARRTEPKRSYYGRILAGARGSVYPGFSPYRLDLESLGAQRALDAAAYEAVLERALHDVGGALSAFQERRKDVFAPNSIPVVLRVERLFTRGMRLMAVDDRARALFLPADRELEERLAAALLDVRLRAMFGDIVLEGVLPTLHPLALLVESAGRVELRNIQAVSSFGGTHKVRIVRGPRRGPSPWIEAAREAGASAASIALAELREELASLFVSGLGTLTERRTEPLVDRLRTLGLEKPAAVLSEAAKATSDEARLPGFVKVFQILEMAVVRLVAAAQVDRNALEVVPRHESVAVPRVHAVWPPDVVEEKRRRRALDRWRAMVHTSRFLSSVPDQDLVRFVHPVWDDGGERSIIAETLSSRGDAAVRVAESVLSGPSGQTAKLTAIATLARTGGERADARLAELAREARDPALRAQAEIALDANVVCSAAEGSTRARMAEKRQRAKKERTDQLQAILLVAGRREDRIAASEELVRIADARAFPALRLSFSGDISREVRVAAAMALARMGDAAMVETFVEMLRARETDEPGARLAISALTVLGDIRGLGELMRALEEGFRAPSVSVALQAIGPGAAQPLLELFEVHPRLLDTKPGRDALLGLPDSTLAEALLARIEPVPASDLARVAANLVRTLAGRPEVARAIGAKLRERIAAPSTDAERELFLQLERAEGVKRRKTKRKEP